MGSTTGAALYPGSTTYPSASTYPGQGERPLLWALYSTDDVSDATPSWQYADSKVRSFSTSRGRDSELDEMDSGTATIALDNRTRTFDPVSDATIRPGNQWWLRAQYCGETFDVFKGYAESYDQTWPALVKDAVAVVRCADEFKRLNLELLPTMDPPRDTYAEVVQSDSPALYWQLHDDPATREWKSVVGSSLFPLTDTAANGVVTGAIKGDWPPPNGTRQAVELPTAATGTALYYPVEDPDPAYLGDLSNVTLETWFQKSANPAAERGVMVCPYASGPNTSFEMTLNTSGQIVARARNSTGTTDTATSTALANDTWYHLVAITNSSNLVLYVNGAQVASTAHTGSFPASLDTTPVFRLGDSSAGVTMRFDEPALYRYTLSATRIAAHYTAGTARGFKGAINTQAVHLRIGDILDTIASQAPRSLPTANRQIQPRFMFGQAVLGEIQASLAVEAKDSMYFTGADGGQVFLYGTHRSDSPWSTAQATYGDAGGSELPYLDLAVDYSDSYLYNFITVTPDQGSTETASDAISISKYGKRVLSRTGILTPGDQATIAAELLAKYKDPFTRITSIEPKMQNTATASTTLARELGDRIRILRTPPGGGSRIDQSPWIQKIEVSGERGNIWRCRLGVSPR